MTEPTETDTPQSQEAPPPPPPNRPHERTSRRIAAVGVIATLALAGLTGGLIARDSHNDVAAADSGRARGGAELDLGAVTVDELSDTLAEYGLVLDITPDGASPDVVDDEDIGDQGLEGEGYVDEGEPRPLATFEVRGDHLETNGDGDDLKQRADALWRRFTELIPADQRQMVRTFELLDADYQGGHVYQDESDHTRWVLGIGEGLGQDLDATVIHEFGHLLTLSARQVPPDPNAEASCDTYFTGEGCALSSSTFARFVERFWPPEMLDTVDRIESVDDEDEYLAAQEAFYAEHADEFVTDYAVTNPGEDLAETFTEFVLRDRPSGGTVSDQKIAFLWNDPAMVALRDQIRSNR